MKSRSYGNGSGEAAGPAAEMISVDSWKGGHMGEKDMAEKLLEDYPDVFADIVNVLLFDGKQEVRSEELAQSGLRSQFKAGSGRMHEEERDVAKYWMKNGRIAELFRKLSDASVRDCVLDGETVEDVPQRFWNHSRIYCEKKEE